MDVSNKMRIAIIGSGVSGILAIKSCREEIQLFDQIICFERTSSIGGLWKYRDLDENDNSNIADDTVTVMHGTIANSSKEMSAFSDFPPPPDFPNFMHHKLMYQYIMSYAKKFDCLQHIVYNSEVTEVSRCGSRWKVLVRKTNTNNNITSQPTTEFFDAVLICTGHHGRPVVPTFKGQKSFEGMDDS
jgi:dimethylaniline monooxygenase (N-oxide forming)